MNALHAVVFQTSPCVPGGQARPRGDAGDRGQQDLYHRRDHAQRTHHEGLAAYLHEGQGIWGGDHRPAHGEYTPDVELPGYM